MHNRTKYEHPDFFLVLNLYFFFGDCETREGFGSWPLHAESTKAQLKRKGVIEARLLQDTSALKKSITYQVVKK